MTEPGTPLSRVVSIDIDNDDDLTKFLQAYHVAEVDYTSADWDNLRDELREVLAGLL